MATDSEGSYAASELHAIRAPDLDPDDLLVIGTNMAEAANCLLHCMPSTSKAPNHPFHAKLGEIYLWLEREGWRLLVETRATTAFGASVKAHALDYDATSGGGDCAGHADELRASLIEDLERLAEAEREAKAKIKTAA